MILHSDTLHIWAVQDERRREAAHRRQRLAARATTAAPAAPRAAARPRLTTLLGVIARSAHAR